MTDNILKHPKADELTDESTWDFLDGGSVTVKSGEGRPLTAKDAIYMLQDVQYRINSMMYKANHE